MMKRTILYFVLLSASAAIAQTLPTVGESVADGHIVRLAQQGYRVGGASLSYDGKSLWLSLKKSPREVHDLYCCTFNGVRWSQPELQTELSSDNSELEPTISSDGQAIYFIREEKRNVGTKKEFLATNLYCSSRQPDGSWQRPQKMPISNSQDHKPVILKDNVTLCFTGTGREEDDKQSRRYYIRKIDKYNWTLPVLVPSELANEQALCRPVLEVQGQVTDIGTGTPTAAHIDIYDALTLRKLSEVQALKDGQFKLILTGGRRYRLDTWQSDYSHEYNIIDAMSLTADSTLSLKPQITRRLSINISAYDAENMSKLSPMLDVTDGISGIRLGRAARQGDNGTWRLTLDIGKDYLLHFAQAAYADTSFHIDTRRDVRFAETDIDVLMHSGKLPVRLLISDAETDEPNDAEVTFLNLTQSEEPLNSSVSTNGQTYTLRCATQYSIQLSKEKYLYKDSLVTLPAREQTEPYVIALKLTPLKKETVVRLKNIEFEFNSYLLKEESFIELHQVAELLRQNPSLRIELSSHTDDVGSDSYNLRLSKKRGEAAAAYLIEQEGINADRLTTVGYGKSRPLVPNDSDENRAINRRVEFTIIEL